MAELSSISPVTIDAIASASTSEPDGGTPVGAESASVKVLVGLGAPFACMLAGAEGDGHPEFDIELDGHELGPPLTSPTAMPACELSEVDEVT